MSKVKTRTMSAAARKKISIAMTARHAAKRDSQTLEELKVIQPVSVSVKQHKIVIVSKETSEAVLVDVQGMSIHDIDVVWVD